MSAAPCILITRPHPEAEACATAFRHTGYLTHLAPLLHISIHDNMPLDSYVGRDFQAIALTSAHALPALAHWPPAHRIPLAVVGEATAAKARQLGWEPRIVGHSNAASLAETMARSLAPAHGPILYAHGRDLRYDLASSLRRQGFTVHTLEAYAAEAATSLEPACVDALQRHTIHAAAVYSPRSLKILESLLIQHQLTHASTRMHLVCLSPTIAKEATLDRWHTVRCAATSEEAAMQDAFKRLYGVPPRITTGA